MTQSHTLSLEAENDLHEIWQNAYAENANAYFAQHLLTALTQTIDEIVHRPDCGTAHERAFGRGVRSLCRNGHRIFFECVDGDVLIYRVQPVEGIAPADDFRADGGS